MNVDQIRDLIARLEPFMDSFSGSFEELEGPALELIGHVESTFVSDISDHEALLLAALVSRLRWRLGLLERRETA